MIGYEKNGFSSYSLWKKVCAVLFFLLLCAAATICLLETFSVLLHFSSSESIKILAAVLLSAFFSGACVVTCFCLRLFAYVFWGIIRLVPDGVQICSPFGIRTRMIQWSEIKMICICYENATPNGPKGREAICFIRRGEKQNGYGRWRIGAPLHFLKVIAVRYSPRIVRELTAEYGANVIDLRETPSYR